MNRIVIVLILLLCTLVCGAEERVQKDTAMLNALSAKLHEYFEAMKYEPVQVQIGECDFLIESTSDSLLKSHVAKTIYDHYSKSPVMGAQAVAIHVVMCIFKNRLVSIFVQILQNRLVICNSTALCFAVPIIAKCRI